jgi:dTDP-glucose 4,6-dehydratase
LATLGGMRQLVTGGAGFIGSNYARWVLEHTDDDVTIYDALTYAGNRATLTDIAARGGSRYRFVHADICTPADMLAAVAGHDVVVHFAAETHVTRSIYDNYHFYETDVLGTQVIANSILRHMRTIDRFIHISTSEVYGTALTEHMAEDHPLMPLSPYASAKAGADRLVYSYWATYRMPAIIVRPFNNYGPRQHLEKVVPRFITSCLMDEPLTVHGDGGAMRDWTFVEDTCQALDKLVHCDIKNVIGEAINVGNATHLSVAEIARLVVKLMGKSEKLITYTGDRPGQVFRHTADNAKAERLLGWTPSVSFEEGLQKTIAWYRANESWWRKQLWMRDTPTESKGFKAPLRVAA